MPANVHMYANKEDKEEKKMETEMEAKVAVQQQREREAQFGCWALKFIKILLRYYKFPLLIIPLIKPQMRKEKKRKAPPHTRTQTFSLSLTPPSICHILAYLSPPRVVSPSLHLCSHSLPPLPFTLSFQIKSSISLSLSHIHRHTLLYFYLCDTLTLTLTLT